MPPRHDQGKKGRYDKGRPRGQKPRYDDRRPRRPPHKRPDQRSDKREIVAKGEAADVGLDGKLRIEMEPLKLDIAAQLSRGRGALVFTPRGDRLGHVDVIIGTLDRPVAVVRVFSDMRKEASEMQGRELYIG